MQPIKDNIHQKLVETGRLLVQEKGTEFLTARKLSEASGCSIGTIYNQFASMDDFIAEQNEITLTDLYSYLNQIPCGKNIYQNINAYVDCFVEFVLNNRQLWFLLYTFHLNNKNYNLSLSYKKLLVRLGTFADRDFALAFPGIGHKRLKLSAQVLSFSLMALSSLLTTNVLDGMRLINRNNLCKLMLNTYLAGLMMLNRGV